jgi:hypothetical protein
MKIAFVCIIACSAALMSCKSNKQGKVTANNTAKEKMNTENNSIVDQWQWTKTSCCGRMPKITTPNTENLKVLLNLKADNTFEKFENATLKEKGSYELNNALEGDTRTMIKLSTIPRSGYLFLQGDTMVIDYGYIDLQTEYYVRKK